MSKIVKFLPLILSFFMLVGCYTLITNATEKKEEYNGYIEVARESAKDEITVDVIENYNKALNMSPSVDLYIEYADYYVSINDFDGAISVAKSMVNKYPKNAKASEYLAQQYINNEEYDAFFGEYKRASAVGKVSNKLKELYEQNHYRYYLSSVGHSNVKSSIFSNYIVEDTIGEDMSLGMLFDNDKGVTPIYSYASFFNNDNNAIAPVTTKEGQAYYIDQKGNKKAVIKPDKITVKQLGIYSSNVLTIYDGSKYYLSDIKSNIIAGPFEYISTFYDGIGVIKNNGKWSIIDTKGNIEKSVTFDNVILDDAEVAYNKGIFAKVNGKYYLFDKNGKKISEKSFTNAKIFFDDYAAVEESGKWGYIDSKGNVVVDFQYQDAKSFTLGIGAVKMNGKWGYIKIDKDSKKVVTIIPCTFDDALPFSKQSHSAIVNNYGKWEKLTLYV